MEKQDIERNLSLLGEQLEELGCHSPIRLLMIGGGFMLTQIGNRQTTDDVDVLVDIDDPMHSEDYRIFKNAVHFVAHDASLNDAWLSDNIGDFLRMAGPIPRGKLWRWFGLYADNRVVH